MPKNYCAMKRLFCICLLSLFICASCDFLKENHLTGESRAGTGRVTNDQDTSSVISRRPVPDTIIYISAIRFPEGYDWQIDTLASSVPGELVLLRDGEEVCSCTVGYDTRVSADPDMHRIIGGRLFSDFSSDSETFILCDGHESFRYPGREAIYGILVKDGSVWTLGQNRSGRGISLRRNGNEVFSDADGLAFGRLGESPGGLFVNKGKVCFYYYRQESGAVADNRRCFLVEEKLATEIVIQQRFSTIMDICSIGGEMVMVGLPEGHTGVLSIYEGGRLSSFPMSGYDRIGSCRIVPSGKGEYLLHGRCVQISNGALNDFVCDRTGRFDYYTSTNSQIDVYAGGGHRIIIRGLKAYNWILIILDGASQQIPGKYRMISRRCGYLLGDEFFLGLNPAETGSQPYILTSVGRKFPFSFNGFITEVNIVLDEKTNND